MLVSRIDGNQDNGTRILLRGIGRKLDEPDFAPLGLRQLPFTPQLSYNPSNDGDTRNPVRPSWNPNFTGPVILGSPNLYFNPAAFTQPSAGTYGKAGRNILTGPGLVATDLSLAKKLAFSERLNLQFRAEFSTFSIIRTSTLPIPWCLRPQRAERRPRRV